MTSDLFFPLIAPRSRAACRDPTSASAPPASDTAAANGSHVIDVGSATASTPGQSASRRVNIASPDSVGGTTNRVVVTVPSAPRRRTAT